jgi:hypothetical protein
LGRLLGGGLLALIPVNLPHRGVQRGPARWGTHPPRRPARPPRRGARPARWGTRPAPITLPIPAEEACLQQLRKLLKSSPFCNYSGEWEVPPPHFRSAVFHDPRPLLSGGPAPATPLIPAEKASLRQLRKLLKSSPFSPFFTQPPIENFRYVPYNMTVGFMGGVMCPNTQAYKKKKP